VARSGHLILQHVSITSSLTQGVGEKLTLAFRVALSFPAGTSNGPTCTAEQSVGVRGGEFVSSII
jgi:hypothetical protein